MRISHKKKFVFIAIPKTGSTTIRRVLDKYSDVFSSGSKQDKNYEHSSLKLLQKNYDIKNYTSFCFVRNPFELSVSTYFYYLKMIKYWNNVPPSEYLWQEMHNNYKELMDGCNNFNDYIFKIEEKGWVYDDAWNTPQCRYTEKVNFVGKFENIQNDFDKVCNLLKLKKETLDRHNETIHNHYTAYYSKRAKDIVSKKYELDIKNFGYTFGKK
jgi:hypothetical protein